MNIGIDVDGVITNLERFMLDYGTKYCIENKLPININVNGYWIVDVFNWPEERDELFWNKNLIKYVTESNPRPFVAEVLKKLQEEGHNIYIITARDETGMPPEHYGKMQQFTKEWLRKNEIEYEKLIFASNEEKLSQCIENKVDVMIEDAPANIINISKELKVIKFDCQYNKHVSGENITTAYSWYHVYEIINKMKEE